MMTTMTVITLSYTTKNFLNHIATIVLSMELQYA